MRSRVMNRTLIASATICLWCFFLVPLICPAVYAETFTQNYETDDNKWPYETPEVGDSTFKVINVPRNGWWVQWWRSSDGSNWTWYEDDSDSGASGTFTALYYVDFADSLADRDHWVKAIAKNSAGDYRVFGWSLHFQALTGSLKTTIEPDDAASAGARWRLTSGPDQAWKESETTISNLPVGTYTITFENISRWNKPSDTPASISKNQTTFKTGTYVRQSIHVTSPDGGETWAAGKQYEITWTDTISDNVEINLIRNGTRELQLAASTVSDGSYLWTIPQGVMGGGGYQIEIRSTADSAIADWSDGSFTIAKITVSSPNGGEDWQKGTAKEITWSDNIAGNVRIKLLDGQTEVTEIAPNTPSDGSFLWSIGNDVPAGGNYKIWVQSIDYGLVEDWSNAVFTISEGEPPVPDTELTKAGVYNENGDPQGTFNPGDTVRVKLACNNAGSSVDVETVLEVHDADFIWPPDNPDPTKIYDSNESGENQIASVDQDQTKYFTFEFTIPSDTTSYGTYSILGAVRREDDWDTVLDTTYPGRATDNWDAQAYIDAFYVAAPPPPSMELTKAGVYNENGDPQGTFNPGDTVWVKLACNNAGSSVGVKTVLEVHDADFIWPPDNPDPTKIYDSNESGENQIASVDQDQTKYFTFEFTIPSDTTSYGTYSILGAVRREDDWDTVLDTTYPGRATDNWDAQAYIDAFYVGAVDLRVGGIYGEDGYTKTSFRPGDTVTIDLEIDSHGYSGDVATTLNIFDYEYSWPNTTESLAYDSHARDEDVTVSLATGGTQLSRFSYVLPNEAKPGFYRILGATRVAPYTEGSKVLDTTGPLMGDEDWSDDAHLPVFTVEPDLSKRQKGITILVHGYNPLLDLDGKKIQIWPFTDPIDYWGRENVRALLAAHGGGSVWVYSPADGRFSERPDVAGEFCSEVGETILVHDWLAASNNDVAGMAEAAAEALFVALLDPDGNGDVSDSYLNLNPSSANPHLHLIGHSRGGVVVSELAQRLGAYGVMIDYVTYLDAHDFDGAWVPFDQNFHDPAVQVWENIAYVDYYWEDIFFLGMPNSRPLEHLEGYVGGDADYANVREAVKPAGAGAHGAVSSWYFGTVAPGLQSSSWYSDSELADESGISRAGYNRGFSLWVQRGAYERPRSRGSFPSAQCVDPFGGLLEYYRVPENVGGDDDFAPVDFFMGAFNLSYLGGIYGTYSIAGWTYHGGGGGATTPATFLGWVELRYASLKLSPPTLSRPNANWRRHNRFYVPADAEELVFDYGVTDAGNGNDELVISLNGPGQHIPLRLSVRETSAKWFHDSLPIQESERGTIQTVTFSLEGTDISSEVWIDNITIDRSAVPNHALTCSVVGGHGTVAPPGGSYDHGGVVNLTAYPDEGYQVLAWSGTNNDPSSGGLANTVTMDSDRAVTVQFEPMQATTYTLDASVVGGHGDIEPKHGVYEEGTVVPLFTISEPGYRVKAWSGADAVPASGNENNAVTMDADRTVTVEFEQIPATTYSLSAIVVDGHGLIVPSEGQYEEGAVVDLTAYPEEGYAVEEWTGTDDDPSTGSNTNSVTMTSDRTVMVQFHEESVVETGSLSVTILPQSAVDAGAQWRRVGTSTWRTSGSTETDVPVGQYRVEFKDIAGWTEPANKPVTVNANQTSTSSGTYVPLGPEISLLGNGQSIASGDMTPSLSDHTSFGTAQVDGGAVTRIFTVENLGVADLVLNGNPKVAVSGSHAEDFVVITQPVSPVTQGGTTTFEVEFQPTGEGLRDATITIPNNDSDKNPYTFALQGTGTTLFVDIDGDGEVNAVDVQFVINAALGMDIGSHSGDANGDGTINAIDVQLVINAALGIGHEPEAALAVSASTVSLRPSSPEATVMVTNSGGGTLSWTASSNDAAVIVDPTSFTGNSNSVTIITADFSESYTAEVAFTNQANTLDSEVVTVEIANSDEETIMLPGCVPLEMVYIPPGTFMMGRYPGEQDSNSAEDPQHEVTIAQGFWLAKYETTKAQWQAVMRTTPWFADNYVLEDPDSSAVYVSWDDAQALIREISVQTDQTFRLPSEAEWEYACRAGTTTRFYWGDDFGYSLGSDYAWWKYNAWDVNEGYEHPVGLKLPNARGLHDMSGNVWELCEDDWHGDYTGAPAGGEAWLDSPRDDERVFRGGSWYFTGSGSRSAMRASVNASFTMQSLGFRLALTTFQSNPPNLESSPTCVSLDHVSTSATVKVSNLGGGTLRWTAVSSDTGVIVEPSSFTGNAKTVTLRATDFSESFCTEVTFTDEENSLNSEVVEVSVIGADRHETVMLPGDVPLEMVFIPAGAFMMGRYSGEQDSTDSQDPQHNVTLSEGFYMSKYELTQRQWTSVMGTKPWSRYVADSPNSPAVFVSWQFARSFVTTLKSLTGMAFRLPSEAEWEYACRAGTATRFYWGDDPSYTSIDDYAWWEHNSADIDAQEAFVVGQKLPNAFGLYDMSGNVWEWCEDDWHPSYTGAPLDGNAWVESPRDLYRLRRGGGWSYRGHDCRSASRGSGIAAGATGCTGFRVAR